MEKCLIIKLQGVCNNSNLEEFGVITIYGNITGGGGRVVRVDYDSGVIGTIKCTEGEVVNSSGTLIKKGETLNVNSFSGELQLSMRTELNVSNKYDIVWLECHIMNINDIIQDLYYMTKLKVVNFGYSRTDTPISLETLVERQFQTRKSGTLEIRRNASNNSMHFTVNNIDTSKSTIRIEFNASGATITQDSNVLATYNGENWSYNVN